MSFTGTGLSDAEAYLKEYYSSDIVLQNLIRKNNKFLRDITRGKAGGKLVPQPVVYAGSQGRSATFTDAQGNQSAAGTAEFQVQMATDYNLATVQGITLAASDSDLGAFAEAFKVEIDAAMQNMNSFSLAPALFRSGTGTIGQINASSISSGSFTLANPTDAIFFARNQVLMASSTDGGGTTRAGTGYVLSADPATGIVVVSATAAGGSAGNPSGWTASDFLFVQGDQNLKIKGLSAWLPFTRPTTGDSFWNVDRSVAPSALAGTTQDLSALPLEEAVHTAISLITTVGGAPDTMYLHPASYTALEKALGARKDYVNVEDGTIGYKTLAISSGGADVLVKSDPSCLPKVAFCLAVDTWKLRSMGGDAPRILTYRDGLPAFRVSNADAVEARIGYYAQLFCERPLDNGAFKLAA